MIFRDCTNIVNLKEKERLIGVKWGEVHEVYPVNIEIDAWNRVECQGYNGTNCRGECEYIQCQNSGAWRYKFYVLHTGYKRHVSVNPSFIQSPQCAGSYQCNQKQPHQSCY